MRGGSHSIFNKYFRIKLRIKNRLFLRKKRYCENDSNAELQGIDPIMSILPHYLRFTPILQVKAKADLSYLMWQQAEQNLRKTTLVAPIGGMVMFIPIRKGDMVLAGVKAVDIADFASPLFEASVDEADVGGVRVGQEAQITVQAYGDQTFMATVRAVAPTGVVASNVVTFKVLLEMSGGTGARPGEGTALLPGMSGKSELIIGSATDVIVIPTSLMARDPDSGEYSVQRLLAGDKIETVKLKTGIHDAKQTEIVAGLKEGDVVLTPLAAGDTGGTSAPGGGGVSATATPPFSIQPAGGDQQN